MAPRNESGVNGFVPGLIRDRDWIWKLEFGICLDFGIWNLPAGIATSPVAPRNDSGVNGFVTDQIRDWIWKLEFVWNLGFGI